MIVSTSYRTEGFDELITAIIRIVNPDMVVELGTQQGKSAIAIARGLREGQRLYTYDLYEETYRNPPYAPTRADYKQAEINIEEAGLASRVTSVRMDAFVVHDAFHQVDVLHMDIGNHYDNVLRILKQWHKRVAKLILIEGGVHNRWQKEHGFEPFTAILEMSFIEDNYDYCIVHGEDDHAMTILTRKGR